MKSKHLKKIRGSLPSYLLADFEIVVTRQRIKDYTLQTIAWQRYKENKLAGAVLVRREYENIFTGVVYPGIMLKNKPYDEFCTLALMGRTSVPPISEG